MSHNGQHAAPRGPIMTAPQPPGWQPPPIPPGYHPGLWAQMSPADQAQAWAQWQHTQAVVAGQRRTRAMIAGVIAVVVAALVVWALLSIVQQTT